MADVTLGERELDVMAVLWEIGSGTVEEVRQRLPAALAYNTVLTVLRNLEAKHLVGHVEEGRAFHFLLDLHQDVAFLLRRVVELVALEFDLVLEQLALRIEHTAFAPDTPTPDDIVAISAQAASVTAALDSTPEPAVPLTTPRWER